MPKEYVDSILLHPDTPCNGQSEHDFDPTGECNYCGTKREKPFQAKVTWHREDGFSVQLATINPEYEHDFGEWEKSGWYVDLDRRAINDLIRVLRRARDQAFGRDE